MSATAPKHDGSPECGDCYEPITEGICDRCAEKRADEAWQDGGDAREKEGDSPVQRVREWTQRRQLLGLLTREARQALELLADDMECGDA